LAGFQPSIIGRSWVSTEDPDLTNQIGDRQTEIRLLERGHDLLDRKSLPLHGKLPGHSAAQFSGNHPQFGPGFEQQVRFLGGRLKTGHTWTSQKRP
jgi:hypothetical protein